MEFLKTLFLVCIIAVAVRAEEKAAETPEAVKDTEASPGEPRFFDELFENLDVKVEKFVNQGSSVVKQVQTMQGVNGGTKIIKTEVTQTFGNPGFRFKRDLFDSMMDSFENKVDQVKNKVAGGVSDIVNVGSEFRNKVHNVHNRIAEKIRS